MGESCTLLSRRRKGSGLRSEIVVPGIEEMLLETGGDRVILVTKTYEDTETFLLEKTVKKGGKRDGKAISESNSDGLVLLIQRGEEEIIPHGDTVLLAGGCAGDTQKPVAGLLI